MWSRWFGGIGWLYSRSVGLVTQKAIRPAAAPTNTFAVYYDRDDLNVSKRARANGDGANQARSIAKPFGKWQIVVQQRHLDGPGFQPLCCAGGVWPVMSLALSSERRQAAAPK
jgi:hypothetical protein